MLLIGYHFRMVFKIKNKFQGLMRKHFPKLVVYQKFVLAYLNKKSLSSIDCIQSYKKIQSCDDVLYSQIFKKLNSQTEVKFLQIGASDGKTNHDPIFEYVSTSTRWKGVLVEPVEFVFSELIKNYSSRTDLIFENVAISDSTEEKPFYYVSNEVKQYIPDIKNYNGLNGFSKENIVRFFGEKIIPFIKTQTFKPISMSTLIQRNKIRQLDILIIDVEGHDWTVFKNFDLSNLRPKVIFIEHQCLSYWETFKIIEKIRPFYLISQNGGDLVGVLPNF